MCARICAMIGSCTPVVITWALPLYFDFDALAKIYSCVFSFCYRRQKSRISLTGPRVKWCVKL